MNKKIALKQIQLMHEHKLITRDSIIGWYYFYSHKLPKLQPERSFADLLRTTALWMELTEKGGSPEFPYDYKSDIDLSLPSVNTEKPSFLFGISWLILLTGLILVFFNFNYGITLVLIGISLTFVSYKRQGGAKNIETFINTSEGKKVSEWIELHSINK